MTDAALLTECRDLALAIAPELSARPLYVVDAAVFDGLPVDRDFLGIAIDQPYTNWQMADRIDGWHGQGPIVALDFLMIAAVAVSSIRRCTLNVLLHEVAHVLPPVKLAEREPVRDEMLDKIQFAMLKCFNGPDPSPLEDTCHDWRFARRCCHLYVRAAAAGYEIPIQNLFGGNNVYQTQAAHYLPLVLAEALRMRDLPFAAIEATDPPAAFLSLWQADLDLHRHYQCSNSRDDL
jgi:hypothetical protein